MANQEPIIPSGDDSLDNLIASLPEDDDQDNDSQPAGDPEPNPAPAPAPAPNKDPYHGKSREQVIAELEAIKQAKATPAPAIAPTPAEQKEQAKDPSVQELLGMSEEEIAKLSPLQFAMKLTSAVTKQVKATVQEQMAAKEATVNKIQTQLAKAKAEYPEIKETKFRDTVMLYINASIGEGKPISLLSACQKARDFLGTAAPAAPAPSAPAPSKSIPKSPSTDIEGKAGAAAPVAPESEEAILQKALRPGRKGLLGGLGI